MTDPPPRVRVTSPRTTGRARRRTPWSAATEIDAQTEVGRIFLRSLLRTQLRLALVVLGLLVLLVGLLPLLFLAVPSLTRRELLGMPVAWGLLAFGAYPVLLLLGITYVRRAERNEAAFTDVIERP